MHVAVMVKMLVFVKLVVDSDVLVGCDLWPCVASLPLIMSVSLSVCLISQSLKEFSSQAGSRSCFFVTIDLIHFLAGCRKRRLNMD